MRPPQELFRDRVGPFASLVEDSSRTPTPPDGVLAFRGSHLSTTTGLAQVFFKNGEYFGELW